MTHDIQFIPSTPNEDTGHIYWHAEIWEGDQLLMAGAHGSIEHARAEVRHFYEHGYSADIAKAEQK